MDVRCRRIRASASDCRDGASRRMPPTGGPSMALHQTECGMEYFTNDVMGDLLERSLETAELVPDGFRDIGTGPARLTDGRSTGSPSPTANRAPSTTSRASAATHS